MPKRKVSNKSFFAEALEHAFRLQDLYEHLSDREAIFVEIPSNEFFVPKMTEKEIKDFEKTGLDKFYRGVHPNVLYVDNKIAFPVNSALLQPYYQYLRYLVSTQVSVWAYAIPLTSQELRAIYKAVFGESLDLSNLEEAMGGLDESLDESVEDYSSSGQVSRAESELYGMNEWMREEETEEEFDAHIRRLFEDKNVRSIYFSQILSPSKRFFQSYFKKNPAGRLPRKGDDSLYGRVPVLSGHTGIAKSAFVKKLEDHTTDENLVSIVFDEGVVLQMRPEVIVFKTGSVAYRELEEAVFAISKIGSGGAEYLVYQTPFFEKFFRASDQFRYSARKTLLSLIRGKTEEGKELPEEYRVSVNDRGLAVHTATGVVLEDKDDVKRAISENRGGLGQALKVVSTIYNSARPAVLFLDELDRNHALLVRNLTTSFVFNRSFQDELTFYSTYIVAAWNRVAPSEREALSTFYITAKTVSSGSADLDEGAFMARFEEVYLDPSSEEVYGPVVDYLVERFEGDCEDSEKLCGVKEFLQRLANTKFSSQYGSEYNLLYYIPGLGLGGSGQEDEEDLNNQRLKGFATYRSYERLLKYLSKKKSEKKPENRIINLTFVGTLLGYLFPTSKDELKNPRPSSLKKAIVAFGEAFANLIEKNFGYNPYDPGDKLSEKDRKYLYERSSDAVLRESVYSGTPVALYGPPGLAKTSKAEYLVWQLNQELFDKIRKDEEFRNKVHKFLSSNGLRLSDDPEEIISLLATKILVIRVGSELMSNPNVISGSNAPMPLSSHPTVKSVLDAVRDSLGNESSEFEALVSLIEESYASILSGGETSLVKYRVPKAKVVVTERFLSEFKDARAVLILDEFTRANFVTQGSFFDALSERIIGGHIFPEEAFERVQVVATGNYSSSIFGTSVSEIDGALIARFANFFQEEPTVDDIDSYLRYLASSILKTVDLSKADQNSVKELESYILREKKGNEEVTFRDLLFSMFYVSGRAEELREFRELIAQEWENLGDYGEVELRSKAPFPSPREVSHFFLSRLLPLWLPQSASLHSQDSGVTYKEVSNLTASQLAEERAKVLIKTIGNHRMFKNPYELASRIFESGLGTIPRYPVPGVTKSLFHPFAGLVFVPEPSEEVFPNLHKALRRTEEAKPLLNLNYQSYSSLLGEVGLRLVLDDKDYSQHGFYLIDTLSEILNTLGQVPWKDLVSEEEVAEEVVLYSKLMVLAAASSSLQVYESVHDLYEAVKGGKIMFFPSFVENSFEKNQATRYQSMKDGAVRQAELFLRESLEIYRRYCNIKLSEALSSRTKRLVTGDEILDTIIKDLEEVKTALDKKFGTSKLEGIYEKMFKELADDLGEVNNDVVYSSISSSILKELNNKFEKRYGISISDARIILENTEEEERADLPENIQEALIYASKITGKDGFANLMSFFSPGSSEAKEVEKSVLSYVSQNIGLGTYYIHISQSEIEKEIAPTEASGGEVQSVIERYLKERLVPLSFALGKSPKIEAPYVHKLDSNVPFVPKLGLVAPGTVTLYGGIPLIPSDQVGQGGLDEPGSIPVPYYLRSSLLNLYYYDKESKLVYLFGVNIPLLVKDMSFTKETERVSKGDELFLKHKSRMKVVFASGMNLVIETISEDPVEEYAVDLAKEVVESEEFGEFVEEAKTNPYVASLVNDLMVLAGKTELVRTFSSSRPDESTDLPPDEGRLVVLPSESMVYWIKSNNYLLNLEGSIPESTLSALRNFVRSQKYVDRYLGKVELPLSSAILGKGQGLLEPTIGKASSDRAGEKGYDDYGTLDLGDETMDMGTLDMSDMDLDKDLKLGPEGDEEEERAGSKSLGKTSGSQPKGKGSSRAALTFISLLRRAITLSRQSISRSV